VGAYSGTFWEIMRKSRLSLIAATAFLVAPSPSLAMVGDVASCAQGQPSVLVRVSGFKQATGRIKVSVYDDSGRWLAKGGKIARVKVPVTGRTMDVCVAVPAAGRYAVAVHHDLNQNGERDRRDGGGYSRNPKVSLLNPKPDFAKAAFMVGRGPARVDVTLLYLDGLRVAPVAGWWPVPGSPF